MTGAFRRIGRGVRRALGLLAWPATRDKGRGGLVVETYRGFGSVRGAYLKGRVFRQPGYGRGIEVGTIRRSLIDLSRRFMRRAASDAEVFARFGGAECHAPVDRDGYFDVALDFPEPPERQTRWHTVDLTVSAKGEFQASVKGSFYLPPEGARYVVISDIDDTIVFTGVANKAVMLWNLFFTQAAGRAAFPGAGAFCRALHEGTSGTDGNPMLYVSRAPWGIYDVLSEFFDLHSIPVGPILFLREWGMTVKSPLPRRAIDHKIILIRKMLSLYDKYPVVLVGDCGQRDPEVYARVVAEHPNRVRAVYIRDVARHDERRQAVADLAREVMRNGSMMLLAADSFAMAEHARDHGLITAQAAERVLRERIEEEQAPDEPTVAEHIAIDDPAFSEQRLAEVYAKSDPHAAIEVERKR